MDNPLEIRRLTVSEYAAWDALVNAAPEGTVYHGSPWMRAVAALSGEPEHIYGFHADGCLVAGVPLRVRRRGPFSLAQRALATPYNGVLVHPDLRRDLLVPVRDAVMRLGRRFSCTTLSGTPFANAFELDLPWPAVPRATWVLRADSMRALWQGVASEVRNRIRKAERAGVIVRPESCPEDFFGIYDGVFRRQGLAVSVESDRFRQFLRDVESLGIGRTYTARMSDGRLAAACVMVYDPRRAYYGIAASHPDLRRNGAPSLLVWEALRDFFDTGGEFDFGGANVPHVAQFKSKFRGQRLVYPEAVGYRSRIERAAIGAFRRLQAR